ncbi:MAG: GNAT family N-acetyltransferase, partial [Hyphomicrobiaceae bacterium]
MNSSRLISRLLSRSGVRTPVRTQRLLLRSPEARDVPEIARLAGDWEVASMTARIPYPYTVEDARRWLAGLAPGEVVLVVEHAGQLVGATGYVPSDDGTSAEIGYWIGKPFWGRGFATEAARALIDLAFRDRRIGTLVCCHFADNPASAR